MECRLTLEFSLCTDGGLEWQRKELAEDQPGLAKWGVANLRPGTQPLFSAC